MQPELFYIPTKILKDKNYTEDITPMVSSVGERHGYCDDITSDGNSNIYSGILEKGCVSKWSLSESHAQQTRDNFVCDPNKLVWINSLFWNDGYLYIVTNE